MDDTVAINATHVEAHDQAPTKEEKSKADRKKCGRKSREERDQWLKEQDNLPIYEKKIEDQLDVSLSELRKKVPINPM